MINVALTIAYDGTRYRGWQRTKEGPSIEEELQRVLEKIYCQEIRLQAASRTDAGVHARGQRVNFLLDRASIECGKLLVSLNSLLPKDIAALEATREPLSFHATLDCKGKEYRYYICNSAFQYPEFRFTSWHYPKRLDVEGMRKALELFLGEADFAAFTNAKKNEPYESTVRRVDKLSIEELPKSRLSLRIEGEKFLYKMVRNIVGAIVYVGSGKLPLGDIEKIFLAKSRKLAPVTAPPHGLFLHSARY